MSYSKYHIWIISSCVCPSRLLYLNTMSLCSIHVAVNYMISLFLTAVYYSCIYKYIYIYIHMYSYIQWNNTYMPQLHDPLIFIGHLGWLQISATVQSAAMNTGAYKLFWMNFFFLGDWSQKWNFWVIWELNSKFYGVPSTLFSIGVGTDNVSTRNGWGLLFDHIPINRGCPQYFWCVHSHWGKIVILFLFL